MPWAEGCSKQYNHHKRGEIISIDGARCCWFHGSLKCILLRISTIIRQLGGWLKWAPGGESETTGKDRYSDTQSDLLRYLKWFTSAFPCRKMFYTVTELYYWVRKIIVIQETNLKISKTLYLWYCFTIFCRVWYNFLRYRWRAGEAGFGRSYL